MSFYDSKMEAAMQCVRGGMSKKGAAKLFQVRTEVENGNEDKTGPIFNNRRGDQDCKLDQ